MSMPRKGYAQYTLFGPDCAMAIRAILPQFKQAGADGVSVDRRGSLLVEFVPRNATGQGYMWSNKTTFALSCEEVGLCISQLPENAVELSHSSRQNNVEVTAGDTVEKVLTIESGEGQTVKFKIDYMMGGVGGQSPLGMTDLPVSTSIILVQSCYIFTFFSFA